MDRFVRGVARFWVVAVCSWSAQVWAQGSDASAPINTAEPEPAQAPVEMVVTGDRASKAQQLQQSAEAVNVVDTRKAKQQSADLGEVLARTQGVAVQRDGGLGSNSRFTLNGLTDDQVRFFLDGVPLELAGYSFGLANVPVNLVERAEVYRGVVPIRFGADALGGAVNLVGPQNRQSYFGASYQGGSFGTHRVTVDGRYRDEDTGLVVTHTAYLDVAKNNYEVEVEGASSTGRVVQVKVPRFHDAYRAYGATLEVGVLDRPWAKRLTLMAFGTSSDKQLQNGITMEQPYGEATYGETVYGATAHYDVALSTHVDLEVTANYSHRIIAFYDESSWRYDWYGNRTAALTPRGEIGTASNSTIWQNAGFARALITWELAPEHTLRVSVSPTYTTRTGQERELPAGAQDKLDVNSGLLHLVSGIEYELNVLDERISNVVFVKDYFYHSALESYPDAGGDLLRQTGNHHSLGAGDALRVRLTPWLYVKASYEYASRLPRVDEVLGNGGLVRPNQKLEPELSHNVNVGPRLEWKRMPWGELTLDVNGFLRDADHLIRLNGGAQSARYENVYRARIPGLENGLSWSAPRHLVSVQGMLTWQDGRNVSDQGQFADLKGDRIPNRPYLFGSWGAQLHLDDLPTQDDTIELFYYGRYVHAFFLSWESLGEPSSKATVPAQVSHTVGVSWLISRDFAHMTATIELQNLTDAKLFDNYRVQRPGRALYAKLTATLP